MRQLHSYIQAHVRALAEAPIGHWVDFPAGTLFFLSFRLFSFAFLVLFVSVCLANDAHLPKREFKTKEQFAQYRDEAWAHFKRRCKDDAKETINRVVENVEAVFLIKPRQRPSEQDLSDQYWMGDPYGYSSYEALNPAGAYLYGRSGRTITGREFTPIQGYRYVDMPNPRYHGTSDGRRFLRYKLENVVVVNSVTKQSEKRIEPRATEVDKLLSRYGVTWEDISTEEDRRYWVAGGKLAVVDLHTRMAIAERIGYVIDPTLGSTAQGRRIWLAVASAPHAFCPPFEMQSHRNTEFVAKVLKAIGAKNNAR